MAETVTCGEAAIELLEAYGVDTVFGIPGVHTLDLCRGLAGSGIRHVQARNEQGAGFMADGFARASGRPGVALVISGPGVTNAATPLGQAYADSIPMLLISAETASYTHGKGWGCLHEITEQRAVTAPLTALSATARSPEDVADLFGQAFSIFASERPRPVHISIPVDVQAQTTVGGWLPRKPPSRPQPDLDAIGAAAGLLKAAKNPVILLGGGACAASRALTRLAERLNAIVITSTAGKGTVPDSHPLCLGAVTVRGEGRALLERADVVLAVGTELAETDSFVERLEFTGKLIRIDLESRKIDDLYPAAVGIVGDAGASVAALLSMLGEESATVSRQTTEHTVSTTRAAIKNNLSASEQQHWKLLEMLRAALPEETLIMGDIAQLVYTGAFAMPVERPRLWHYPAGFCTLGCGLPNAIGAKLSLPERPVIVLAGDGGVMFTIQELVCASELGLSLPIIIWENGGLKQIQDDMHARNIPLVGVEGVNPNFTLLAQAMGCDGLEPDSAAEFQQAVGRALDAERPTVIVVHENAGWLQ